MMSWRQASILKKNVLSSNDLHFISYHGSCQNQKIPDFFSSSLSKTKNVKRKTRIVSPPSLNKIPNMFTISILWGSVYFPQLKRKLGSKDGQRYVKNTSTNLHKPKFSVFLSDNTCNSCNS